MPAGRVREVPAALPLSAHPPFVLVCLSRLIGAITNGNISRRTRQTSCIRSSERGEHPRSRLRRKQRRQHGSDCGQVPKRRHREGPGQSGKGRVAIRGRNCTGRLGGSPRVVLVLGKAQRSGQGIGLSRGDSASGRHSLQCAHACPSAVMPLTRRPCCLPASLSLTRRVHHPPGPWGGAEGGDAAHGTAGCTLPHHQPGRARGRVGAPARGVWARQRGEVCLNDKAGCFSAV